MRSYRRRVSSVDGTNPRGAGNPLAALGFDKAWMDTFAPFHAAGMLAGRVCSLDRSAVDAVGADGPVRATFGGGILQLIADDPVAGPCTGDWVALRAWPDGRSTLEAILPRRTTLGRGAAWRGRGQPVAANVDLVLVTVSLEITPNLTRTQSLLALARASGAETAVVLTKADLQPVGAQRHQSVMASVLGVDVLVAPAFPSNAVDRLSELAVPSRTVALIGEPGVGKSTLVTRLAGDASAAVAPGPAHSAGRRTTTREELLILPTGALVVDTPGLLGIDLDEPARGSQGSGLPGARSPSAARRAVSPIRPTTLNRPPWT